LSGAHDPYRKGSGWAAHQSSYSANPTPFRVLGWIFFTAQALFSVPYTGAFAVLLGKESRPPTGNHLPRVCKDFSPARNERGQRYRMGVRLVRLASRLQSSALRALKGERSFLQRAQSLIALRVGTPNPRVNGNHSPGYRNDLRRESTKLDLVKKTCFRFRRVRQ